MIGSKHWKSGIAIIFMLLVSASPIYADLTPGDAQAMTTCLETLSQSFNQPCSSTVLMIIEKPGYTTTDLAAYFQNYFTTRKLNQNLYNYLTGLMYGTFSDATRFKSSEPFIQVAETRIGGVIQNYPANLGQFLAGSQSDRDDLILFMRLLARVGPEGTASLDKRALYNWTRETILRNPNYLGANLFIDPAIQPYVNYVRMQMHIILRDTLELTDAIKADIAMTFQLSGDRLRLWNTHSTLIHDNQFFNARDFQMIQTLWDAIPEPLTLPGNLSVNDALWPAGAQVIFPSVRTYVNVFGIHVGDRRENDGWPGEVQPVFNDLLVGVTVHESNHVVECGCRDSYVNNDPDFRARKQALLQDAGSDRLNYLRSVLPDGFFAQFPQEFFASISNMYLINTELTFEAGRARLQRLGRYQPIEQFLFFMDVYSRHTNISRGYVFDINANLAFYDITLERDTRNRIISFSLPSGSYVVAYGANGHVSGVTAQPEPAISPTYKSFSTSGGAGGVSVTAPSGTGWTAISNVPWITISSGSSGNGNGSVSYSVAGNNTPHSRAGAIIIAGKTFHILQSAYIPLTPGHAQMLTRCLEVLSQGFDQKCANDALYILERHVYDESPLTDSFNDYFATRKLNQNLYNYLSGMMFGQQYEFTRYKVTVALSRVAKPRISAVFQNHPADLGQFLDGSPGDRDDFASFLRIMARIGPEGVASIDKRADFGWARQLIAAHPNYLATNLAIDPNVQPFVNWVRMEMQVVLSGLLPLTAGVKSEIATALQLNGPRLQLWESHTALAHDNQYLNPRDYQVIQAFFDAVPPPLPLPGHLQFDQSLGNVGNRFLSPVGRNLVVLPSVHAGSFSENVFPNDVQAVTGDVLAGYLIHRINQILDLQFVNPNQSLQTRKNALIQDAGGDRMNYLRSNSFDFTQAPQEFIPSAAQMYLTNTAQTFEVGRARLQQGRHQPMEQFLFFLDLYSLNANLSRGYAASAGAGLTTYGVALLRDTQGRAICLTLPGNSYVIGYAANGRVSAVTPGTISLSATSQAFPPTGGTGNVSITIPDGCPWSAVSNAPWITITAGSGGNGSGTVSYSVAANTGAARTGTLTVAGLTVTVMQASAVTTVSAASFSGAELASESIVAAFGTGLATATQVAATLPLPTELAGTSVKLRDSAGAERLAPLFFVAPAQINYLIPRGTAPGDATVVVTSNESVAAIGGVKIAASAPGLFTANASGQGIAAGVALRIKGDGAQVFEPITRFDPAQNRFVAAPIDLGPEGDQVILILFGTGFRNRGSLSEVAMKIGGADAEVLYAGPQGDLAGLDQINVRLPRSLMGRGEVDMTLVVNGKTANPVKAAIK